MDALNEWTLALCACAAAVSLAEMLLPEGAVKKTAYFVLSLITASCLAAPLKNIGDFSFNIETRSEQPYTDWFSHATEEEFSANIRKILEDTLSSIGVKAEKIYVETDISDDGSVYINKARITVDERYADRIAKIERAAQTAIGVETDVRLVTADSTGGQAATDSSGGQATARNSGGQAAARNSDFTLE